MENIHNTTYTSQLTNGLNNLEFYITPGQKDLPIKKNTSILGQFASYKENKVL